MGGCTAATKRLVSEMACAFVVVLHSCSLQMLANTTSLPLNPPRLTRHRAEPGQEKALRRGESLEWLILSPNFFSPVYSIPLIVSAPLASFFACFVAKLIGYLVRGQPHQKAPQSLTIRNIGIPAFLGSLAERRKGTDDNVFFVRYAPRRPVQLVIS